VGRCTFVGSGRAQLPRTSQNVEEGFEEWGSSAADYKVHEPEIEGSFAQFDSYAELFFRLLPQQYLGQTVALDRTSARTLGPEWRVVSQPVLQRSFRENTDVGAFIGYLPERREVIVRLNEPNRTRTANPADAAGQEGHPAGGIPRRAGGVDCDIEA